MSIIQYINESFFDNVDNDSLVDVVDTDIEENGEYTYSIEILILCQDAVAALFLNSSDSKTEYSKTIKNLFKYAGYNISDIKISLHVDNFDSNVIVSFQMDFEVRTIKSAYNLLKLIGKIVLLIAKDYGSQPSHLKIRKNGTGKLFSQLIYASGNYPDVVQAVRDFYATLFNKFYAFEVINALGFYNDNSNKFQSIFNINIVTVSTKPYSVEDFRFRDYYNTDYIKNPEQETNGLYKLDLNWLRSNIADDDLYVTLSHISGYSQSSLKTLEIMNKGSLFSNNKQLNISQEVAEWVCLLKENNYMKVYAKDMVVLAPSCVIICLEHFISGMNREMINLVIMTESKKPIFEKLFKKA